MTSTAGDGLHRFNASLPREITDVVAAEAGRYFADLKDELEALVAPSNGPIFDIPALLIVARKIKSGIKNLKYQMTDMVRVAMPYSQTYMLLSLALHPVSPLRSNDCSWWNIS